MENVTPKTWGISSFSAVNLRRSRNKRSPLADPAQAKPHSPNVGGVLPDAQAGDTCTSVVTAEGHRHWLQYALG